MECVISLIITEVGFIELSLQIFTVLRKLRVVIIKWNNDDVYFIP
jgi:hypothetical protein